MSIFRAIFVQAAKGGRYRGLAFTLGILRTQWFLGSGQDLCAYRSLHSLPHKGCTIFHRNNLSVNLVDRDALLIPEANKADFDTRIFSVNLGTLPLALVDSWLKEPQHNNPDAAEAFCQSVTGLQRTNLKKREEGKFTNYYLTAGVDKKCYKVRPTMLITLHGQESNPELGFAHQLNVAEKQNTELNYYGAVSFYGNAQKILSDLNPTLVEGPKN